MRISLYDVELLYSNSLKGGYLYIQWNPSIATPRNEDTSIYSETPLLQLPEMRIIKCLFSLYIASEEGTMDLKLGEHILYNIIDD